MTTLSVRQRARSLFPELSDWITGFHPVFESRMLRLEDEMKDGTYEVRAELPGIDPVKDVDITVRDGLLTIKAERSEKKDFDGRSEFSYGSFHRTVPLPAGADEDDIRATCDKGVLTVSVPVLEARATEKHVQIQAN